MYLGGLIFSDGRQRRLNLQEREKDWESEEGETVDGIGRNIWNIWKKNKIGKRRSNIVKMTTLLKSSYRF